MLIHLARAFFAAAARACAASRPAARISSDSSPLPATRDITSAPIIVASAPIAWRRAVFRGNEFELSHAVVDFTDRTKVEIDCGRLRRMDFVSAGTLFNIVSQLHTQGRLVVFKNVNSMVAALMQVMGLHQVARIELRN